MCVMVFLVFLRGCEVAEGKGWLALPFKLIKPEESGHLSSQNSKEAFGVFVSERGGIVCCSLRMWRICWYTRSSVLLICSSMHWEHFSNLVISLTLIGCYLIALFIISKKKSFITCACYFQNAFWLWNEYWMLI